MYISRLIRLKKISHPIIDSMHLDLRNLFSTALMIVHISSRPFVVTACHNCRMQRRWVRWSRILCSCLLYRIRHEVMISISKTEHINSTFLSYHMHLECIWSFMLSWTVIQKYSAPWASPFISDSTDDKAFCISVLRSCVDILSHYCIQTIPCWGEFDCI